MRLLRLGCALPRSALTGWKHVTDLEHSSIQPKDYDEREKALDIHRSLLCEAPAGSGKTALLTQRILKLLTQVERPEAVLALTFTRKAAAEMRQRVLTALRDAEHEFVEGSPFQQQQHALSKTVLERDKRKAWNLLQNPTRLRISTFDSLCSTLTRGLPLQSSLGFNLGVADDPFPFFERAVQQLLDMLDDYGKQHESLRVNLSVLLKHLDNRLEQLLELLVRLLAKRDVWMPLLDYGLDLETRYQGLMSVLRDVVAKKTAQLTELIERDIESELAVLLGFASGQLQTHKPDHPLLAFFDQEATAPSLDKQSLCPEYWQAIAKVLLTDKGELRKSLTLREGFPPGKSKEEKAVFGGYKKRMMQVLETLATKPELVVALHETRFWPVLTIDEYQHRVLDALLEVLPHLVAELQLVFGAVGQVDFIEVAARARQALGSSDTPSDLLLKIDQHVDHILVDEFQDTSFHQTALLALLSSGWSQDDGRTLFCVGDAMQSIYGFRGANVGLFLKAKEMGVGHIDLDSIQLSTNFRSAPEVVSWVNRVFKPTFPSRSDIELGAVPFAAADAFFSSTSKVSKVETVFLESEDYAIAEARDILRKVTDLKSQYSSLSNEAPSMAILVRNRKHAITITKILREAKVGFTAVELEPLSDSAAIKDLLSLSRALLNPLDRIAWLACLRAPWCGLLLKDLEVVASNGDNPAEALLSDQIKRCLAHPNELSKDGCERLERFYAIMHRAWSERSRKTLRDWVKGTWQALGGYHLISANEVANVDAFFDLLEMLESKIRTDSSAMVICDQLELAVSQLYAQPGLDADANLQIMTMHKAKGLEFDIVFLPGLHHRARQADQDLMLWYEHIDANGEEQVFFAPLSAKGAERDQNYRFVNHEQKKRASLELARLFYVACTRAKSQLYLYANVQCKVPGGDPKPPTNGSLLSMIWPNLLASEKRVVADLEPIEREADVRSFGELMRVQSGWVPPVSAETGPLDRYVLKQSFDNQALVWEGNTEEQNAQHLGTAVHKALEHALRFGDIDLMARYKPVFWQQYLRGLGVTSERSLSLQARHREILDRVNQHEKWHWLQHKRHQTRVEWPVVLQSERYVLDAVVFEAGQVWIIDYKTLSRPLDQAVSTFEKQALATFLPTMKRYAACLKAMGYHHVRCVLFLVAEGLWVPYDSI